MVALLTLNTGEPFADGTISYLYQPATQQELLPRILLRIEIEGRPVVAVLDTGAPYVLCPPLIARQIGIYEAAPLGYERILIRGTLIDGYLYRLNIKFSAEVGENLETEATVFAPTPEWEANWGNLPAFIGLSGCLERMRFAIDPRHDLFYFGPI